MEDRLTFEIDEYIELFNKWACKANERKIKLQNIITDLNKKKNNQSKIIRQYRFQILLNNIRLKVKCGSIVKLSKKYAISKTDKKIKSKKIEILNNNEYFELVCDINKEIDLIKNRIYELETKINIISNEKNETQKNLKFYKNRLMILNSYLDLLFSRVKQLSISSRVIEDEMTKIKKMK